MYLKSVMFLANLITVKSIHIFTFKTNLSTVILSLCHLQNHWTLAKKKKKKKSHSQWFRQIYCAYPPLLLALSSRDCSSILTSALSSSLITGGSGSEEMEVASLLLWYPLCWLSCHMLYHISAWKCDLT